MRTVDPESVFRLKCMEQKGESEDAHRHLMRQRLYLLPSGRYSVHVSLCGLPSLLLLSIELCRYSFDLRWLPFRFLLALGQLFVWWLEVRRLHH